MRQALIAAVVAIALVPQTPGAQAPQAAGPKVQVTFESNGLVSLVANGATVREILAEWGRQGGSTFVNAERLGGAPLTLHFQSQPEKDVIASLLRQAAGYLLGPRRAGTIGVSAFEVVYILPTSNPSLGGYSPSPTPYQQQPPLTTVGNPDDEISPVGRGGPPPNVNQPTTPGPQPGPEYRPATPTGGGVAVPVVAIPPVTTSPPPPTNTGRGAGS